MFNGRNPCEFPYKVHFQQIHIKFDTSRPETKSSLPITCRRISGILHISSEIKLYCFMAAEIQNLESSSANALFRPRSRVEFRNSETLKICTYSYINVGVVEWKLHRRIVSFERRLHRVQYRRRCIFRMQLIKPRQGFQVLAHKIQRGTLKLV